MNPPFEFALAIALPIVAVYAVIGGGRLLNWISERQVHAPAPEPIQRVRANLVKLRAEVESTETRNDLLAKNMRLRAVRAAYVDALYDAIRVRGLPYGDGPRRTLDLYHRRDRQARAPVLLHLHGGRFSSGNKTREARPLIRHLTSRRGFVCVSANYRLQPHVTLADQVADVRDAIAWIRAHAADYGADPRTLFLAGSSAGANLAIRAVCDGETGIAGLICRYGYYGDLSPRGGMPPMLVLHGEKDMRSGVRRARLRGARTRRIEPPGHLRRTARRAPRLRPVRVHPVHRGQPGSGAVHREGQHFPRRESSRLPEPRVH